MILKRKPSKSGIVHLGFGNFHRAHLSVYTALAMQEFGGEWGILGYSRNNKALIESMTLQENLYSVVEIGPSTETIFIPGIHTTCLVGVENTGILTDHIANPDCKIVSISVTEAGYYISHRGNTLNLEAPDIKNDLAGNNPRTIFGIITEGIKKRILQNSGPFTVMSCDNISQNGSKTKALLIEFVRTINPNSELLDFINESMSFPNSMVDRIVPSSDSRYQNIANSHLGVKDEIPVPTETFSMWAVEDNFVAGRPSWERVGVIFTDQVEKFELMKLRLLNGSHSLLAYLGGIKDLQTIPECRFDPLIEKALNKAILQEYLPSISMPTGQEADSYIAQLFSRWSNTTLGDKTYRVGTDGSTKLPQRITEPALLACAQGREPKMLAITVAAWLICIAPPPDFAPSSVSGLMSDTKETELKSLLKQSKSSSEFVRDFFKSSHIFSEELASCTIFTQLVENYYLSLLTSGVDETVLKALED